MGYLTIINYIKGIFRLNCPNKDGLLELIKGDILGGHGSSALLENQFSAICSHVRECKRCKKEMEFEIFKILSQLPLRYLEGAENPYKVDGRVQAIITNVYASLSIKPSSSAIYGISYLETIAKQLQEWDQDGEIEKKQKDF